MSTVSLSCRLTDYLLVLILCLHIQLSLAKLFTNEWAVHIKGGPEKAKQVAEKNGFIYVDEILSDYYNFYHHHVTRRSATASNEHHSLLAAEPEVLWAEQQRVNKRVKRDMVEFNDAYWKNQWYLYRQNVARRRLFDMNVMPAWAQGYSGKGVVVTILDDGIEWTHPDLLENYDSRASTDVNSRDMNPMPRYDYTNENRHGTRCAGEVAAVANNSFCGVGVAYEASIGGIRMLDGDVTDSVEARSLSYNRDHIDIYSASWGPDDDGRTVDGPGSLARQAFREGVILGRRGKGSIFIWASGNGGRDKDSCNCDGYTNSIYTLSISSATENGNVPWYSEACSSTLTSTYSSGDGHEQQIVTTDLRKSCTKEHTGTSASAPLAAGIAALALQANPSLTWRDMQHLVVMSSNPHNLNADDWVVNGVGRRVSHHFGYGIMNAAKMVELAKNWKNVPPQRICEVISSVKNRPIAPQSKITIKLNTDGCERTSYHVLYLEHVQAKISLTSSWRGDIVIWLTSPMGTKSTLLSARANDDNNKGFNEWEFMTTHNWGEYSKGEWILEIENGYRASATLQDFVLVLHGTGVSPYENTDDMTFSGSAGASGCSNDQVLYRDKCVDTCPHGWYSKLELCYPCHLSCAACTSSLNTSCTECYHGSFLNKKGICLPLGEGVKIDAGASVQEQGLPANTLWWLMVGATIAVCMLVMFLVLLAVYYAYTQNYLCDFDNTCTSKNPDSVTASSDTTSDTSAGTSPEHTKLTSQNSSQQELVSSEDEDGYLETHRLRNHITHRIIV